MAAEAQKGRGQGYMAEAEKVSSQGCMPFILTSPGRGCRISFGPLYPVEGCGEERKLLICGC